ncbi:MAG: hypothetical protein ACTSU5_13555 [Promethearchaeota archaeon]
MSYWSEEDSVKQDLVPVIASMLGCNPDDLYTLPVEVLNEAFETASSGVAHPNAILQVVRSMDSHAEMVQKLRAIREVVHTPRVDDGTADLVAGITALFPDPATAGKVRAALSKISDANMLNRLAGLPPTNILVELGLVAPLAAPPVVQGAPVPAPGKGTKVVAYKWEKPGKKGLKKIGAKLGKKGKKIPGAGDEGDEGGEKKRSPWFTLGIVAAAVVGLLLFLYFLLRFVLISLVGGL